MSNHRFVANYFRLMMHSLADNLLVRQRQFIALPFELDVAPAAAPSTTATPTAVGTESAAVTESSPAAPSKKAVKSSPQRQQFNARRREDPLGEGHISTWQTRIIKVACEVIVSTRRIVIRLSPSWPYLEQVVQVREPPPLRFRREPTPLSLPLEPSATDHHTHGGKGRCERLSPPKSSAPTHQPPITWQTTSPPPKTTS